EDYRFLAHPHEETDFFDPIKYVPLNKCGTAHLTLGGEVRERYEYFHNPLWGSAPQDPDGYLLQRYMLHSDLHWTEQFRLFVQLKSGLQTDRTGGPRPPDRDELDLHQAFVDVKIPIGEEASFTLRPGRQELAYGSSRLVSVREGPNVRQSFDAMRGLLRMDGVKMDFFGSRPVETDPGIFDDGTDSDRALWGVYSVFPLPVIAGGNVDLYYLGFDNEVAEFDQSTEEETRHTIGTRIWGEGRGWDYNFEFVYQFGSFGGGDISAWTAASDTGYTFKEMRFAPRIGLRADITSGDRDPSNPDLQTFNPLFPRGSYFTEAALIGPVNHIDLHPSITLQLTEAVTLTVENDVFWRESTRDGLYGPAVNLLRSGENSDASYVGTQPAVTVEYELNSHFSFVAHYSHFFSGRFIKESGPGEDVDYVTAWVTFKF
ncbi:MAG TPA: alginate export family protein, partial [Candidatus Kapabacteria bacterium]|nr:alginate export family protein [Candidatus Kapabacteria bacterium]